MPHPRHRLTAALSKSILLILFLYLCAATHLFAACTGADPCEVCKNCKYCKHCAKDGGSCGVCKKRA